jgi:preprotein translocase subunit SecA
MWENIQQRNKEEQLKYEKEKLKKEQAAAQEALRRAKQENLFQVTGGKKIGRNEPCPCGSGKKFKKCHGA